MEQAAHSTNTVLAHNTLRAYGADWADFSAWSGSAGVSSMPAKPENVARYLSELAETHKISTLQRRMVSITYAHKAAGFDTPVADDLVRQVWDRITRPRSLASDTRENDSWARRIARVKGASDLMFH